MILKEYQTQWAWLVTNWLNHSDEPSHSSIGMNSSKLNPISFRQMVQKPENRFFLFSQDSDSQPLGFIALSDLNLTTKTARIWYLCGNTALVDKKELAEAVNQVVRIAFDNYGLESLHAWCLSSDSISREILNINHFNFIGRQRQCFVEHGKLMDKLLFDMLAKEYQEYRFVPAEKRFLPYHERSSLQNINH